MNDNQEIKIGTTDDDRNELNPSCRVEFDTTPRQVESLGGGVEILDSGYLNLINAQNEIANILDKYGVAIIATCISGSGSNSDKKYPVIGFQSINGKHEHISRRCHITGYELRVNIRYQREERERIEAGYELYTLHQKSRELRACSFDKFASSGGLRLEAWLAILDKTGYSKEAK